MADQDRANLIIRLPRQLREDVKDAAKATHRTLQAWVEDAVRERLEREDA